MFYGFVDIFYLIQICWEISSWLEHVISVDGCQKLWSLIKEKLGRGADIRYEGGWGKRRMRSNVYFDALPPWILSRWGHISKPHWKVWRWASPLLATLFVYRKPGRVWEIRQGWRLTRSGPMTHHHLPLSASPLSAGWNKDADAMLYRAEPVCMIRSQSLSSQVALQPGSSIFFAKCCIMTLYSGDLYPGLPRTALFIPDKLMWLFISLPFTLKVLWAVQ